mmetsp:Transcript_1088/g.2269  ORF Transcript_1088/g.2269 Transcript_1088/m.2269 type:complete len:334 (+) Transcript_1088:97-1098(+)
MESNTVLRGKPKTVSKFCLSFLLHCLLLYSLAVGAGSFAPVPHCRTMHRELQTGAAHMSEPQQLEAGDTETSPLPSPYLVICNISKRQNMGTLLRCATAFGVRKVLVAGSKKLATFGHQGTSRHVTFLFFESLEEVKAYLHERNVRLCAIEIDKKAVSLRGAEEGKVFKGSTAFVLGHEGDGLSAQQIELCDDVVFIPQFGDATASLNVAVAGSIVLWEFAKWARLPEAPVDPCGYKFKVKTPRSGRDKFLEPNPDEREAIERKRQERARKRAGGKSPDGGKRGADGGGSRSESEGVPLSFGSDSESVPEGAETQEGGGEETVGDPLKSDLEK